MMRPAVSEHAKRAAEARGIPYGEVASIVAERVPAGNAVKSWAVFCGWAQGWAGASNGDEVWAIVRAGVIRTVMYRRRSQPKTPAALDVERVIS